MIALHHGFCKSKNESFDEGEKLGKTYDLSGMISKRKGISDSTYFRKQVLNNLEKHGYLEKSKVSRAAFYKTNFEMVNIEQKYVI